MLQRINWTSVAGLLESRFKREGEEALTQIKDFLDSFKSPFHWHWFSTSAIDPRDLPVVLSICIAHGADIVDISHRREIQFGLFRINYKHNVEFSPSFRNRDSITEEVSGEQRAYIRCVILGWVFEVRTLKELLKLYAILVFSGILLYVLATGALLYCLTVIILFVAEPELTTIAAMQNADIGVALLGAFVMGAAIFGRAVRNLYNLAKTAVLGKLSGKGSDTGRNSK
jgi:hypothetical protein